MFPDDDEASIPSGLSALTSLTSLMLDYRAHNMQLDWLTALSGLQSFVLEASQADFPASCSIMTSLKTLEVELVRRGDHTHCNLFFHFNLGTLTALQRFDLRYATVSANSWSGLASLHNLQEVSLMHVTPFGAANAREMGLLAFQLGRNRQDVQFQMPAD